MTSYLKIIYDRLDFLEFKQSILLLKQPQHKASIFNKLTLEDFLKIKNFTLSFEDMINAGNEYTIDDYERELFKIWSPIKSYPSSSTLVAKTLMSEVNFNSLFRNLN